MQPLLHVLLQNRCMIRAAADTERVAQGGPLALRPQGSLRFSRLRCRFARGAAMHSTGLSPIFSAHPSLALQVLSFAGELLANAETLLRDGLHPTEIADGYARAGARALEILDTLVVPGKGEPRPPAGPRGRGCFFKQASGSVRSGSTVPPGAAPQPALAARRGAAGWHVLCEQGAAA